MNSLICSPHGASTADVTHITRPIKDGKKFCFTSHSNFLLDLVLPNLSPKQVSLLGEKHPIRYAIVKGHQNVTCGRPDLVDSSTISCDSEHNLELEFQVDDETLAAYAEVILSHYDDARHKNELMDENTNVKTGTGDTVTVLPNSLFYLFCRVIRDEPDNTVKVVELKNPYTLDKQVARSKETEMKYKRFLCMCSLLRESVTMHIRGRADIHLTTHAHDTEEEEDDGTYVTTEKLFTTDEKSNVTDVVDEP